MRYSLATRRLPLLGRREECTLQLALKRSSKGCSQTNKQTARAALCADPLIPSRRFTSKRSVPLGGSLRQRLALPECDGALDPFFLLGVTLAALRLEPQLGALPPPFGLLVRLDCSGIPAALNASSATASHETRPTYETHTKWSQRRTASCASHSQRQTSAASWSAHTPMPHRLLPSRTTSCSAAARGCALPTDECCNILASVTARTHHALIRTGMTPATQHYRRNAKQQSTTSEQRRSAAPAV